MVDGMGEIVFFAIPSAAPIDQAKKCVQAWKKQGYRVAVFREKDDLLVDHVDLHLQGEYLGYAASDEALVDKVGRRRSRCA